MKLTEKQAFKVVEHILNYFEIKYDKMELTDFVMLDLINLELGK